MAKNQAVWGLEIGRSAVKALRCRIEGDAIVADAFDFIEYPKLLSQPDAEVALLIREALTQFLSRNSVKGDKVAIAVTGESGLAKYFKPPPVDRTKIPDIVKYEAKQQIPFALEDVIWDFQLMAGYRETDGFVMDSEIGLFAMKREQVFKALQPFLNADIPIDIIQLAPLAIYNYVAYDLCPDRGPDFEYEPTAPPPSFIVMSMGTDTTDLVVTNGFRVWQRNIPIGGNHFTKQLSKELKLTFARAEHVKRNPRQSEDPKAIFQAMRTIFSDIVTEVQRSVSFFRSLDRKAHFDFSKKDKVPGPLIMLGNTSKLPGLYQYVSKHLGYEGAEITSFNKLAGSAVVASPSFKENVLSFATCYGLCIQGLGKSKLSTNLLPKELLKERQIQAKKPWAVAAVGGVLLACAVNFMFHFMAWNEVHLDRQVNNTKWSDAISDAERVKTQSTTFDTADKAKLAQLEKQKKIAEEVVGSADRKLLWLELQYAINQALPVTPAIKEKGLQALDPVKLPFEQRQELHIIYVESEFFPELKLWYNAEVKQRHEESLRQLKASEEADMEPAAQAPAVPPPVGPMPPVPQPVGPMPTPGAPGAAAPGNPADGPVGPGWVIELHGYHLYQPDRKTYGPTHVRNTLIRNLEEGEVSVPLPEGGHETFTMKELGIQYPILAFEQPIDPNFRIPNPNYEPPTNQPGVFSESRPMDEKKVDPSKPVEPPYFTVPKYTFSVQFCWQEKRLSERLKKRAEDAAKLQAAPTAGPVAPGPVGPARPPVTPTSTGS